MKYDGHMTYIEAFDPDSRTNTARQAHAEEWDDNHPTWEHDQTDPESRRYVSESDMESVTQHDRDELQTVLDWEERETEQQWETLAAREYDMMEAQRERDYWEEQYYQSDREY